MLVLEFLNEKIPVFDPTHAIKMAWDFIYFINLLILLWIVPIKIAIKDSWSESIPIQIPVINFIFMLIESLINMNTGFFETGEII